MRKPAAAPEPAPAAPSAPPGGEVESLLCFAVYEAGHAFNRAYKPHLDALGLTYPQYLALTALSGREAPTVGELGAMLSLESSTLTPLLKRLEAAGHVERRRDGRDERVVRVRLTEAGRALAGKARLVPGCIVRETGLDPADLARLRDEILRLSQALRGGAGEMDG